MICVDKSFFLWTNSIPLHMYATLYLSNDTLVDICTVYTKLLRCCFELLITINNVSLNIYFQALVEEGFCFSWKYT